MHGLGVEDSHRGISVILCCYNSVLRIEQTLQALNLQVLEVDVKWEIILVDNASTDKTADVAASIWADFQPSVKLTIVTEQRPGLAHARRKGIASANYNYLLFCDDDTWLSHQYVFDMFSILSSNDQIAACGGHGIPVFESSKPYWFDEYQEAFAVGSQDAHKKNDPILNLYGAGMGMNRNIYDQLMETGFRSLLVGRIGKSLSSAEDTELTYAFAIMGYTLHYDSRLIFHHYLPAERLSLNYVKKLFIAFGSDGPIRNLYHSKLSGGRLFKLISHWPIHVLFTLCRLVKYLLIPPKKYGRSIYFNWCIAYLKTLQRIHPEYAAIKKNMEAIGKEKLGWAQEGNIRMVHSLDL